jgi:D-alanyl-D-alanine carboxypeptidase/D-alanyl-D-alanine-endopeptidase (penicillin-binding protein 4)
MLRHCTTFLLWAALLAPGFTAGRTQEGRTPELRTAVNTEVAAARRVAPELGVHIVELASGETVYSFNPDTPRILASNTKVVTTAAALDRLGPGFLYETEVLIRGEVRGGVLAGDLAVLGSGDPGFSGRDYQGDSFGPFRDWAAALREHGVDRVAGDLVLVDGLFDDETVHPDWPRDQLTRWYEAPVSALSFNDNCVLVKVSPDGSDGAAARVETVPPLPIFRIESTARTTGRARDQWLRIDRDADGNGSESLTVGGRVYRRTESVDQWVTVADPVRYFGSALRAALAEEGVAVEGGVRRAETLGGGGWRRVHLHLGDLLTTLEVINKRSQNFYAESVLKLLGARLCDDGSWAGGVRAVTEFLAEVGFPEGSYRLADGSGMSRNNRFSPAQVTALLRHMFFHRWGSQYLKTFPHSGERDLKWARRLAKPPYLGNVLAKTGWLSGVSTLSGYAKARSGKVYAFSILCNSARTKWQAEKAQDRIVQALIDHG